MDNTRIDTRMRLESGVPVLDVVGEIDLYTTPQFKDAVAEAIDAASPSVIIDMSRVSYMDSSGFGTLLSATKRLRPVSGSLFLVGANESITRMLAITRLNTIFSVYPTLEDAIQVISTQTK